MPQETTLRPRQVYALVQDQPMIVRALPILLGAAYALLLLALFGPGGMTVDSFSHWHQGSTLDIENWHPPLTAFLMRGAQALGARSPWPILIAQAWLLGSGVCVFLRDSLRAPPAKILALSLIVLLTPPVLLHAHMMWKDTWCAVAFVWTCIYAQRLYAQPAPSTWLKFSAWAIVTAALRHNALVLIALLLAPLLVRAAWKRQLDQLVAGLVLAVATFGAPRILERVARARDLAPVQQIFVHDLAGIEGCNGFADWPRIESLSVIPREALTRGYTVNEIVPLFDNSHGYPTVNLYEAAPHVGAIAATWREVVRENPGCYARHRLAVFNRLLGADGGPTCYAYESRVGANQYGIASFAWWPRATALVQAIGNALENTILFRLWFYVVIGIALFAYFARERNLGLCACLAAALAYQLAYFFVATTCDFRLGSALVIAVWLGAMVWASQCMPNAVSRDDASNAGHRRRRVFGQ